MSKKTVAYLAGVIVLAFVAIAVYAAADTGVTPTNDASIANAEVAGTGVCCLDCDGDCENCEGCDGNCEDCDGDCRGHGEGRMCGGHGDGDGNGGKCGGHKGNGSRGCGIWTQ